MRNLGRAIASYFRMTAGPHRKPLLRRIIRGTRVTLPPPPYLPPFLKTMREEREIASTIEGSLAELLPVLHDDGDVDSAASTTVYQSDIRELFPSHHDSEDRIQTLIAIPLAEAPLLVIEPEREDEALSALLEVYEEGPKRASVRPSAPPPLPARAVEAPVAAAPAALPAIAVLPVLEKPVVASLKEKLNVPASIAAIASVATNDNATIDTPFERVQRWAENAAMPVHVAFVVSCAALASLVTTLLVN
jgi:hypothetical protein